MELNPEERSRSDLEASVESHLPGGTRFCGVAAAVAVLGDAWTLLLLRDLAEAPRRFSQLHASAGISERVLADRLRTMAANGLVTRRSFAEVPPRVEYALTQRGRDALVVVAALRAFGERWLRPADDTE